MKQEYKKTYTTILKKGYISNELELEQILIIERKLRLLIPENPSYKEDRKRLRNLIKEYEKQNWSGDIVIKEEKIKESDAAERNAEEERIFLKKRKEIIQQKLKECNLTQQELGIILNHNKSYISQLMNGIYSFTKKDLIIIHQLLGIKIDILLPTTISKEDKSRIENTMQELGRKDLISKLYSSEKSNKTF